MKNILTLLVLTLSYLTTQAQVTCTPVFPGPTEAVVITFNANEGSKGLASETGDVYAHTGIITDRSTSPSDWKYVKFPWTTNDPSVRMTRQGGGIYTLSIPNIRSFYNVPAADKILKMAFVFRNANGSREGKTADGGDIFYDVVSNFDVMLTKIISPSEPVVFISNQTSLAVKAAASLSGTLTLTDNGTVVKTLMNAKDLNHDLTIGAGLHTVVFKAVSGDKTDSASFTYVKPGQVTVADPPRGALLGATMNAAEDSLTLLFQAPNKQNVYVLGSFNDFKINDNYLMKRSVDGKTWWLKIGGLQKGQTHTYQYLVDGSILVADPLSTLVLDPANDIFIPNSTYPNRPAYPTGKTTGIVSVVETGKTPYVWKVNNFQRPLKSDLVIYELLVRDFSTSQNYQKVIDSLPYLKRLGINVLQLMPINEFENNESWGYNPSFHMALDKYYGTADKLKELVDKCHENGIAVVVDIVFNHAFGQSPLSRLYFEGGAPSNDNPWLNRVAKHEFNVGYDMNHESEFTKAYTERCLRYWLSEFRIDGYRFDLSKGFTQRNTLGNAEAMAFYDQSRIDILTNYHNVIQQTTPGAYTILEHFADNNEETVLANNGMMLWGNMNGQYRNLVKFRGDNSLSGVSGRSRGWLNATNGDKLIGYMESHDEERLMFDAINNGNQGNAGYDIRLIPTALKRVEAATAFFYTVPGPKMLWQFGELGYDISINFNGRVGNKPVRWNYYDEAERRRLFDVTRNIIHLKTQNPVFRTLNFDHTELNTGSLKAFHLSDATLSITILGNFGVNADNIIPAFQSTGKWYDYMTGDSITVTNVNAALRFLPGEYRIYTNKKLPTPPAGFIRFTTGTADIADFVNDFMVYPTPSVDGQFFIGYNLKKAGTVSWSVVNGQGQILLTAQKGQLSAGSYQDAVSQPLPAGIYFIRLNVNGAMAVKKMVVGH